MFQSTTTDKPQTSGGATLAHFGPENAALSTVEAETEEEDSGNSDHPTGVKLAFIVTALMLSVFLFSLDQVSL